MLSLYYFVIIITAISATISATKRIQWYNNPLFMFLSYMNLIADILTQVFIAYKWPIIVVSWVIITDPLTQDVIKYLYNSNK